MKCFADNDIVLKLAACDLIAESLLVLGINEDDVRVLPTAKFFIARSRRKLEPKYGSDGVDRALRFVQSARVIDFSIDLEEQRTMSAVEGIDSGELILFGATRAVREFVLLTGDKRSLRALWEAEACVSICERLTGRIVCFEQLIHRLLAAHGFDSMVTKVVPASACDTALLAVFGSREQSTRVEVENGLISYISELRSHTGSLLSE